MWRDGEDDRTVDVTLGYDLNTCLLRLSSDQSSLCQAPLPAGNFSMHVTPSFTSFSFCFSFPISLFFIIINFLSISWSLSSLPSFVQCVHTHLLSASPSFPSLYLPLCAFSRIDSPGPLVLSISLSLSPCLRISRKEIRGVKRTDGKWMRDTRRWTAERYNKPCCKMCKTSKHKRFHVTDNYSFWFLPRF